MALSFLHYLDRQPSEPSSTSSYEYFRNEEIKRSENDPLRTATTDPSPWLRVLRDTVRVLRANSPRLTIGYGFDITARAAQQVANTLAAYLMPGVTISQTQIAVLDAYRLNQAVSLPGHPLSGRVPTVEEVEAEWGTVRIASKEKATELLNFMLDTDFEGPRTSFENKLNTWLGYAMDPSRERAALLSLTFNNLLGPGRSPGLKEAIARDERAEAWFEIRYNSNAGQTIGAGIAARRYRESDLFSLYGDAFAVSEIEAKDVIRTYTRHRIEIATYEQRWNPTNLVGAQGAMIYQGASARTSLAAAEQVLIDVFVTQAGLAVTIPTGAGQVLVGNHQTRSFRNQAGGLITYHEDDSSLQGTPGSDLILGEGGNDKISSEAGADVLVGGTGDDTLNGGAGADVYLFKAGEGLDTIVDADGTGEIHVAGQKLTGATKDTYRLEQSQQVWEVNNGEIIYRFDQRTKRLEISGTRLGGAGNAITIENFSLANNTLSIQLESRRQAALREDSGNPFAELGFEPVARSLSTSLRHSPKRNYCRSPLPSADFGGLIQTAVGGSAGRGTRRTNRSGCAA